MRACSRYRWIALAALATAMTGASARAQVAESATGGGHWVFVGAQYSNMEAGFPKGSDWRLEGPGAVATLAWNHRLGVEANADFLQFHSWYGEKEQAWMIGPRYTFLHSPHWLPFAVFQLGAERIRYPFELGRDSFFAIAPGGGVEYRVNSRLALRAEYRYLFLPGSPDFTNEPKFGIHPNGFQAGFTYRVLSW